ncbi:treslin [Hyla sarda]|uniref:treslin n=1 Tax=Hyla sarda TaxID=327740 RepID=UPI0024C3F8B1|nr:treslin [Hyla sarda]
MASSHNVVLLVDAADSALKDRIKLVSLRLLNFLTCRAGLGQVRWSYRFLNSVGGRCRPPRRSDLRELGPRSWDEFEEELEACWERSRHSRSSRAALTHTALMETLSDFQWDRPDITSPAKPAVLRGRRRGRLIAAEEPLKAAAEALSGSGCKNAVFLLSPCPHSRAQLGDFTGEEEAGLQQVMDRLLSRGLQNLISNKRVTLYWLDTSDWAQVWETCDHFGYWTMVELMQCVSGRIIPSECLLESSSLPPDQLSSARAALSIPYDSVLCSLLSSELEYRSWFPQQDGLVTLMTPDAVEQWECAVSLEPISITQKRFKNVVTVRLKGTMENWNQNTVGPLRMESWLLQSLSNSSHSSCLHFNQLLNTILSKGLFLVADVSTADDFLPRAAILSPISENAAVLNVICSDPSAEFDRLQDNSTEEIDQDIASDLPDIVNSVLNHVFNTKENTTLPEVSMPEWINQELSQSSHWGSSVIERWYPLSGISGASSNLMESFRLISAASFDEDQKSDLVTHDEFTCYLSEFYQKKTDESGMTLQGETQKKRLPPTPVRQKMKTMPRALQLLNAARLNSKAQKLQPEGAPVEKSSQAKRRSSEKPEGNPRKPTGFKSEEELNSFLIEDYDKMVSGEDDSLLSCVRNALTTIKSFFKSAKSKHIETDCIERTKLLLKTSKTIRQLYQQNQNKAAKLRECQMQALLRLEICVQCPSIQTHEDELEQVVEEITDMLRIISLTEDPSYLTKFMAGILTEYIGSIPKILADIYFSLGTQIPEELKLVLPTDGDDSFMLDGQTPMYSQPSILRVPSVPKAVNEEDQLEELRTRSAKKRRTSTMTRHRSIAESSQSSKQIELLKKPLNRETSSSNLVVMVEKLKMPLPVQPQKDGEATKARRNLFVQENRSPTRRSSKMLRSHSVSAVEGLKRKRTKSHDDTKDHYKLLTKKVTETPAHKQMSNRLLYKQIKGRHSESTSNISVVEESPVKDLTELDLRRSPRIKQLALKKRNSSFYAAQPKSRNLERVHSASQQTLSGGSATQAGVKTPKRLLFGEVLGFTSPPTRRARRKLLADTDPELLEKSRLTPKKMQKSISYCEQPSENRLLQTSPRTPRTPVCTPKQLKIPSKTPLEKKSAAKNLGMLFSPSRTEERTPSKSAERRSERLAQTTPSNSGSPGLCLISPLRTIRQPFTPLKDKVFKSPQKTPQKSAKTNTPVKMTPLSCTPRKSPRLQGSNIECFTPTRYLMHTPQKVSETPKKHANSGASILPFTVECTPEKATFFTPRKTADSSQSQSINTSKEQILSMTPCKPHLSCTPRKSPRLQGSNMLCVTPTRYLLQTPQKVSKTPTPKKHANSGTSMLPFTAECTPEKAISFTSRKTAACSQSKSKNTSKTEILSVTPCKPTLTTPRKSILQDITPSCDQEDADTCKFLFHSMESKTLKEANDVPMKLGSPSTSSLQKACETGSVLSSSVKSSSVYNILSSDAKLNPIVFCERLDMSSLESSEDTESFVNTSQTDESIDITDAKVVPTESCDLKMKVLIKRKSSDVSLLNHLPTTPKGGGDAVCTSPYGLRCTVDRRQREAAARLGTPQIPAKFSTPKSHRKLNPPPVYEVELEMQASGLPKLRFKRTDSNSTIDMGTLPRTPNGPPSKKGNESPFGEMWCNKHAMKLESACASPCIRSSHSTPGKSGLQALICQTYTPKRSSSSTASPSQAEAVSPWTPSPKYKDKNGRDVFNNWPRKKKAFSVKSAYVPRQEKNQDYAGSAPSGEEGVEPDINKASPLGDLIVEGVSKLLDQSPVLEWKGKTEIGAMPFKSRKRPFDLLSPTKDDPSAKRSCTLSGPCEELEECVVSSSTRSSDLSSSQQSFCEDEVFTISAFTPPNKVVKNTLSASGLLALTHSPMLFKGKTPSKRKKQDGESQSSTPELKRPAHQAASIEDSPFSQVSEKRTISRTYTRKKLIT